METTGGQKGLAELAELAAKTAEELAKVEEAAKEVEKTTKAIDYQSLATSGKSVVDSIVMAGNVPATAIQGSLGDAGRPGSQPSNTVRYPQSRKPERLLSTHGR